MKHIFKFSKTLITILFVIFMAQTANAIPIGNDIEYIPYPRNLGVGEDTPTSKLVVNGDTTIFGQIQITGGSPALSYVLTSDATGLATWQPVVVNNTTINNTISQNGTLINGDIFNSIVHNSTFLGGTINGATIINSTFTGGVVNGTDLISQNDLKVADDGVFGDTVTARAFIGQVFNGGVFRGTFTGDGSCLTGITATVNNTTINNVASQNGTLINGDIFNSIVHNSTFLGGTINGATIINSTFTGGVVNGTDLISQNDLKVADDGVFGDTVTARAFIGQVFNGGVFRGTFTGDGSGLTGITATTVNNITTNNIISQNGTLINGDIFNSIVHNSTFLGGTINGATIINSTFTGGVVNGTDLISQNDLKVADDGVFGDTVTARAFIGQVFNGGVFRGTFTGTYTGGTINGANLINSNISKLVAPDGSPNPALSVDNSGNIGIGTVNPISLLHVAGPSSRQVRIEDLDSPLKTVADPMISFTTSNGAEIGFVGDGSVADRMALVANTGDLVLAAASKQPIYFRTQNVNRMILDGNGNVGMGVLNPLAKLHVAGDIIADNLTFNGGGTINGANLINSNISKLVAPDGSPNPVLNTDNNGSLFLRAGSVFHFGGNHYNVLSYKSFTTPTNGIKIKTNIPFTTQSRMPTIIIEGYDYGQRKTIGWILNWYLFNNADPANPIAAPYVAASSFGGYTPVIKIARENGMVVIFVDDKQYFNRFSVRAYDGLANGAARDDWYEGWTAVDEALTGDLQATFPFKSSLGEVTATNVNATNFNGTFSGAINGAVLTNITLPSTTNVNGANKLVTNTNVVAMRAEQSNVIRFADTNYSTLFILGTTDPTPTTNTGFAFVQSNNGGASGFSAPLYTGGIHIGGNYDGVGTPPPIDGEIRTTTGAAIHIRPNNIAVGTIFSGINGNVGFGKVPLEKVDVAGNVKATKLISSFNTRIVTAQGTSSALITATCDSDEFALNGGGSCAIGDLAKSYPASASSWAIQCPSAVPASPGTAYVTCAKKQ